MLGSKSITLKSTGSPKKTRCLDVLLDAAQDVEMNFIKSVPLRELKVRGKTFVMLVPCPRLAMTLTVLTPLMKIPLIYLWNLYP
jgi:hypothetical protein